MKTGDETPGLVRFSEQLREQLAQGPDRVRRLLQRARELRGETAELPEALTRASGGSLSTVGDPPRRGGGTWEPAPRGPDDAFSSESSAADVLVPVVAITPRGDDDADELELPPEFVTATMGQILLGQGRFDLARRVFEALLTANRDDAHARRGLAECDRALAKSAVARDDSGAVPPGAIEPHSLLDRAPLPEGYGDFQLRALPVDPTNVVVFWELPESVVPAGIRPALQLVSLAAGPFGVEHPVRRERVLPDIPRVGDYFFQGLPAGATHHIALGQVVQGVFHPLTRSVPVTTPRGLPSVVIAQVQATIALPPEHAKLVRSGPVIVELTGPSQPLEDARELFRTPAATAAIWSVRDDEPTEAAFPETFAPRELAPQSPAAPSSPPRKKFHGVLELRRRVLAVGSSDRWLLESADASSDRMVSSGQWA